MSCVTSVSYAVLVNETHRDFFQPTNSIHQGDPLSPLIFILCADVIGDLVKSKEAWGFVKGVKYKGMEDNLTHSLFADDLLITKSVTNNEVEAWVDILDSFSKVNGLVINKKQVKITFLSPKI